MGFGRPCFHEIRRATGAWLQSTKSSVNNTQTAGNEKLGFHGKLFDLLQNTLKSYDFDEQFITRESICGHFYPGGLGWGGI